MVQLSTTARKCRTAPKRREVSLPPDHRRARAALRPASIRASPDSGHRRSRWRGPSSAARTLGLFPSFRCSSGSPSVEGWRQGSGGGLNVPTPQRIRRPIQSCAATEIAVAELAGLANNTVGRRSAHTCAPKRPAEPSARRRSRPLHHVCSCRLPTERGFGFADATRSLTANLFAGVGYFVTLRGDATAVAPEISFCCGGHIVHN